jgi:cyclophilin family peptidyl-prolyl cis-trans isomerase
MVEAMKTLLFLLLLSAQLPVERAILEAEDARSRDVSVFVEALKNPDPKIQRLAVRALGRLERPEHAAILVPLLSAQDAGLRKELINALGQMGASVDMTSFLNREKDADVRGILYAMIGRLPQASERILLHGLAEESLEARIGAARGLEAFYRLNAGTVDPTPRAIEILRKAIRENESSMLRKLALLTLNAAGDAHEETLGVALKDVDPQVRRLAVRGAKQWRDDDSYLVRYESLRVAGNCERAVASLKDPNPHVALLAIDMLGRGCPAEILEGIIDRPGDWRRQSHALVSLAKVHPSAATARLEKFSRHPQWQVRAYAAEAAKLARNEDILSKLIWDEHPNVIAAALTNPSDAVGALVSRDYGLILRATQLLEGWTEGSSAVPPLLNALKRITREGRATSRDPRLSILKRLGEYGSDQIVSDLRPFLSDFDPEIARSAADIIAKKSGQSAQSTTLSMATRPLPAEAWMKNLRGAQARIQMEEAGGFTLELIPEEAPVTVAIFAELAEQGYFNNLTVHRIVPNFVIQGGSPGANEYMGTAGYIRDELGLLSHERGTVGISTRGRDTGDCQIFINLVDNFRLDHNYTVFARVVEGMENVDRIQEGDVIRSLEIVRRPPGL